MQKSELVQELIQDLIESLKVRFGHIKINIQNSKLVDIEKQEIIRIKELDSNSQ
ncbi:MAG: DUF2292 domain-containing protein [Candidatus Omnitrophica bacterium]|nr:DUF2292 domain-containing protein [Candidatus Omnitrophota bacterium]